MNGPPCAERNCIRPVSPKRIVGCTIRGRKCRNEKRRRQMGDYRKLGRRSDQRKALLRNQVTALLYNGKIVTTLARAKEVQKIAEPLIALGVKERDNYETVKVTAKVPVKDKDGKRVKEVVNGKKVLYPVTEVPSTPAGRKKGTKKADIPAKIFDEYGVKYANRHGGYTRIIKIGQRTGDGAMEVGLELV